MLKPQSSEPPGHSHVDQPCRLSSDATISCSINFPSEISASLYFNTFADLNRFMWVCAHPFFMGSCVCVFVLSFLPCRFRLLLSLAAVAGRSAAAACRCRLSLSFAAAACRLRLSLLFLPLSLSSWSVRPCFVLVLGRCRCRLRGPRTLVFDTYDLPSLAKAIQWPLWREICPRGPQWLSVHTGRFKQMPCEALYAQVAQLILVNKQDFLFRFQ